MALAVSVNFTVLDMKGKSSVIKMHVPTGFSIAQYGEFCVAMGELIAVLSDGEITSVSLVLPLSLSGATLKATATLVADVAKKVLFMAGSAITGLFARFTIPTYDENHNILFTTDEVNLADTDVAALVAIIEGGAGASPTDLRGNNLTTVFSGREIFRRFN